MVEKKSVTIGLVQTRVSDDIKTNIENTITKKVLQKMTENAESFISANPKQSKKKTIKKK